MKRIWATRYLSNLAHATRPDRAQISFNGIKVRSRLSHKMDFRRCATQTLAMMCAPSGPNAQRIYLPEIPDGKDRHGTTFDLCN